MTPQELKYSILQLAFQGRFAQQIVADHTSNTLGFDISDPPFEIPETWKWQTLGKCCEMYTGNSISESEKIANYTGLAEGYDYIATKDVSFEQTIEYDNDVRIPFDNVFKRGYKNSVLMCIEGGSAGRKIGMLDRDVCFGNKLCMFRAKKVLNTFLFYYLQSIEFKKSFSENLNGIIGGVSIKKLKELLIPIPPFVEQKRIVAKIEELLPYIDRYEQSWSKLENFNKRFPGDMQKSILQMAIQGKLVEQRPEEGTGKELYQQIQVEKQRLIKTRSIKRDKPLPEIVDDEKPFDIPESWKWDKVGNILEIIRGSSPRPKGSPLYWANEETEFNWVTIKDISDNSINGKLYQTHEYLTMAGAALSTYVDKGELIIAVSGSTTGKHCILGINGYIYDGLAAVINRTRIISSQYVMFFFDWMYEKLNSQKIGSAFPNINTAILKNTLIPIPPLAEQKRIVTKLEAILPLCKKLNEMSAG